MHAPITVSLVSHGHTTAVAELVQDLLSDPLVARLVLTLNVPQTLDLPEDNRLIVLTNDTPKGFGQNHNQAFSYCESRFFLVLNPDVKLRPKLLTTLLACQKASKSALVAPAVVSSTGEMQDSWRRFPTMASLIRKAFGHDTSVVLVNRANDPTTLSKTPTYLDWVAGMCMLFETQAYKRLGGFDEKFYLYYEDVDICARIWLSGGRVAGCKDAFLVHDAQRASRRQWRHLRWHLISLLRYLWRYRDSLKAIREIPEQGIETKRNV